MSDRYTILPENVDRITEWLRMRGGLAIWTSIDLSDPGASMTTPATNADGTPKTKPHWMMGDKPVRIITDINDVWVSVVEEVKRFRVGVRMGSQGMSLKVTDGGTRRIRREVSKAGEDAYYQFDYDTQEAVIMKPASQTPLAEVLAKRAGM